MTTSHRNALIEHLRNRAVRTDGPFTLRSGVVSSWYLDARQTTFDGEGARLIGAAVAEVVPEGVDAVGGLTMGADPIAIATAMTAGAPLRAFSVRKEAKSHGTGGRLVGPVGPGDRVLVVEDTTTTGAALVEAIEALRAEDVSVVGALSIVDRSEGVVADRMAAVGVPYRALVRPADLGVTS